MGGERDEGGETSVVGGKRERLKGYNGAGGGKKGEKEYVIIAT